MMNKYDELKVKYDALVKAAKDLHWMSRRYANGRQTYAASLHNDATKVLLNQGIELNPTADGTIWALDGGGRNYDHLTAEQATSNTLESLGRTYYGNIVIVNDGHGNGEYDE